MPAPLLGILAPLVGTALERFFPDKNKLAEAQAEVMKKIAEHELEIVKQMGSIIKAEYEHGNWLSKSWRPIFMFVCMFILVSFWFGYMPPNINEPLPPMIDKLFTLITVGMGGYIGGRSLEKTVVGAAKAFGR